jgi:fermentation-respiration switch protein FrsA (DUF1100 family)
MRFDIEFPSHGITCAGWLYVPDDLRDGEQRPAIVMAHGFGAVKEAYLDDYAALFCAAGFVVTVFDYRGFGESRGEPRNRVDPPGQIEDYRNAISWTQSRAEVDPERIGVWGSSFSGGHAMFLARADRRVKAAVAQVPFISGFETLKRMMPPAAIAESQAQFGAERLARYRTGAPDALFPVFAPPGEPALFATPDAYAFWVNSRHRAPNLSSVVTLDSVEATMFYEPMAHIEAAAPTPLLFIVAKADDLTHTDLAVDAYERASEPKKLVMIDGGHFDAYTGTGFEQSSPPAVEWFVQHLLGAVPAGAA